MFVWSFSPTREFFTHLETSPLPVKGCKFWPMLCLVSGHFIHRPFRTKELRDHFVQRKPFRTKTYESLRTRILCTIWYLNFYINTLRSHFVQRFCVREYLYFFFYNEIRAMFMFTFVDHTIYWKIDYKFPNQYKLSALIELHDIKWHPLYTHIKANLTIELKIKL